MEIDLQLLLADIDNADIRQVYEVLKRHWSEVSKDKRFLGYTIGGSLSGKDRKNKYIAMYLDSMTDHLSRPYLVPRCKFLGPQDSREMSVMACLKRPSDFVFIDFSHSTDIAVLGAGDKISAWSAYAQKKLSSFSLPDTSKRELTSAAISANGELIVSGHKDGTFMRWDARNGKPVGVRVEAHSGALNCLTISKDASTIVTASDESMWKKDCAWLLGQNSANVGRR